MKKPRNTIDAVEYEALAQRMANPISRIYLVSVGHTFGSILQSIEYLLYNFDQWSPSVLCQEAHLIAERARSMADSLDRRAEMLESTSRARETNKTARRRRTTPTKQAGRRARRRTSHSVHR